MKIQLPIFYLLFAIIALSVQGCPFCINLKDIKGFVNSTYNFINENYKKLDAYLLEKFPSQKDASFLEFAEKKGLIKVLPADG